MNGNSVISAFITNAGKYAEGELIGQWVDFPTEKKVVQRTLKEIGVDGVNYEEYFMSDYNTEVEELIDYLPEYCDIDELNYLAAEIGNLGNYELEIYEAALELGYNLQSVKDLINLTDNTDCYGYLKNVTDDNDLGYYWIEESGCYDTKAMGNLSKLRRWVICRTILTMKALEGIYAMMNRAVIQIRVMCIITAILLKNFTTERKYRRNTGYLNIRRMSRLKP